MTGLDTSILVAHAIAGHPLHREVRQWIGQAVTQGQTFALTSGILAEFIHIVTDGRRFERLRNGGKRCRRRARPAGRARGCRMTGRRPACG